MDAVDVLKVKITHANTVRGDKKPYTIYEIEVRSSSTITWVIYKRYSEFNALHWELVKAIQSLPVVHSSVMRSPALPPKRLTRSLSDEFVNKRKLELQEYLREILIVPSVFVHAATSSVLCKFLTVPDSVRPMLVSTFAMTNSPGGSDTKKDYKDKTYDERCVLELVHLLKLPGYKVAAVKHFEDYVFTNRPHLTNEYIRILLQGHPGTSYDRTFSGLVACCGDFSYSHVAGSTALELLVRLLDVEMNKDATAFVDQFVLLDAQVLRQLQLHSHILSNKENKIGAFKIIDVLRSRHKQPDQITAQVVPDTWARQEYITWSEKRVFQAVRHIKEPVEHGYQPPTLTDQNLPTLVAQTIADFFRVYHTGGHGWRNVVPLAADPLMEMEEGPDLSDIHMSFLYDHAKQTTIVKCSCVMPFAVPEVVELLTQSRYMEQWDIKLHYQRVVAQLGKATALIHNVAKTPTSPYQYVDISLLATMGVVEGTGMFVLASRSVQSPLLPENAAYTRGICITGGWTVQRIDENSCHVVRIVQFDQELILTLAPDLLGEQDEIKLSMVKFMDILRANAAWKKNGAGGVEEKKPAFSLAAFPVIAASFSTIAGRAAAITISHAPPLAGAAAASSSS